MAVTCGCPVNEAGDIRCHVCREYANVRYWNFDRGKDNAAGIRGTIARLSQLNDDGTWERADDEPFPQFNLAAPPPKVDALALSADAAAHISGLLLGSGSHCKCAERRAAREDGGQR